MLAGQLDTYLDHLTVERGAAANTLSSYRRDLDRYLDYLTDCGISDLAEVREEHVAEFVAVLRRGDPDRDRPALAASSVARA